MPSEEAFIHFGDIYSPSISSTADFGRYEIIYLDINNNSAEVREYFVTKQSKFEWKLMILAFPSFGTSGYCTAKGKVTEEPIVSVALFLNNKTDVNASIHMQSQKQYSMAYQPV